MNREKRMLSIILTSLLLTSTLTVSTTVVMLIVNAGSQSGSCTKVTINPQFVSGVYPYVEQKFVINVTLKAQNDTFREITNVTVVYPSGWVYVGIQTPSGWTMTHDSGTRTIIWSNSTPAAAIGTVGSYKLFNVTLKPIPGANQQFVITCKDKDAAHDATEPLSPITVNVSPWFHAEISPIVTNENVSTVFSILLTNNASNSAIKKINITYPSDYMWVGDYEVPSGWSLSHDSGARKFILEASAATYYITKGSSRTFRFNMTAGNVVSTSPESWTVSVVNVDGASCSMGIITYIDPDKPSSLDWSKPTGYAGYLSVYRGYIWLNITFQDKYYGSAYMPTAVCNNSKFSQYGAIQSSTTTIGATATFTVRFRNNTAISDGKLVIQFNVTDCAGNRETLTVTTWVDNTAPVITIAVEGAASKVESGITVWYIGSGVSSVNIWVNFTEAEAYDSNKAYDASLLLAHKIGLYVNGTWQIISTFNWDATNKRYYVKVTSMPVQVGRCYRLFANITDAARPYNHTGSALAYLKFDTEAPSAPTFTVEAICGGAVIKNLAASDNIAINKYKVYINGTKICEIEKTQLENTTALQREDNVWAQCDWVAFNNVLVLKLSSYAGRVVNITITAVDYGNNEGGGTKRYVSIPAGAWYPIELLEGWNLISLPLVPANSSINAVLSLLLKASPLKSIWTYNAETRRWHSYAPGAPPDLTTMVDGKSYFVDVTDYTVLIIQGTEQPLPPELPRAYHVVPGWNMIGYKRLTTSNVSDYLSGIQYVRVYKFDASTQSYQILLPSSNMEPGYGYWVAVTAEGWIYP